MGHASDGPARHDPFGHLYLSTIMMVLALVVATSFAIMLLLSPLMSLPLCHPILGRGRGSRRLLPVFEQQQPRHRPAVAIARPRGRFIACAHHRFHRRRTSRSSSRPSPCSSSPTCCPRSQSRADRRSLMRVWANQTCSWPFSVRAAEEDTVAPATIRLSWR